MGDDWGRCQDCGAVFAVDAGACPRCGAAADGIPSVGTGRVDRMLTVLLAACDPLDAVGSGGAPAIYTDLAVTAREALTAGGGEDDLIVLLDATEPEPARAFARAAADWWATQAFRVAGGPR